MRINFCFFLITFENYFFCISDTLVNIILISYLYNNFLNSYHSSICKGMMYLHLGWHCSLFINTRRKGISSLNQKFLQFSSYCTNFHNFQIPSFFCYRVTMKFYLAKIRSERYGFN